MNLKYYIVLLIANSLQLYAFAQSMPDQMVISDDGTRLSVGGQEPNDFYNIDSIRSINLIFDEPNYWSALTANYASKTDLAATMIYNGDTLAEQVGVRFKGQTSYMMNMTDKKSFNITIDYIDSSQDIHGYNTLNLNCGYEDPSFMRESVYENNIRKYIPGLAVNYVHLYLNGEDWGLYLNVQQLNKDYYKEWFMTNDGTSWRAEKEGFGGPGGGDPFGAGYCSLNYLGTDSSDYTPYYQLKSTDLEDPWTDLINTTDVLNNTADASLEDAVNNVLDLDRTLWFLALEIIFSDDDSYVNKGGMDYYVYWEKETDRIVPMEYDGNSCMDPMHLSWTPFYHETDADYALLNVLLGNDNIRQRYLAHMRTILDELFNSDYMDAYIDAMDTRIDALVNADPKKIYTYAQYNADVTELKTFVEEHYNDFINNTEIDRLDPEISETLMYSAAGDWIAPLSMEAPVVTTNVYTESNINGVNLYYGTGLVGRFYPLQMFDDGAHNDGLFNDGTWGANLPAMPAGTDVRYYIEAIADDGFGTRKYDPVGAEHDVYYYQVRGNVAVEDFIAETIIVYPNPATDMVQIILPSSNETADIELFSLGGNSVLNQLNYKSGAPINVSKIAPGCYFLHTKQNEVTAITKIIIQ